jgi:hypothetical protein
MRGSVTTTRTAVSTASPSAPQAAGRAHAGSRDTPCATSRNGPSTPAEGGVGRGGRFAPAQAARARQVSQRPACASSSRVSERMALEPTAWGSRPACVSSHSHAGSPLAAMRAFHSRHARRYSIHSRCRVGILAEPASHAATSASPTASAAASPSIVSPSRSRAAPTLKSSSIMPLTYELPGAWVSLA